MNSATLKRHAPLFVIGVIAFGIGYSFSIPSNSPLTRLTNAIDLVSNGRDDLEHVCIAPSLKETRNLIVGKLGKRQYSGCDDQLRGFCSPAVSPSSVGVVVLVSSTALSCINSEIPVASSPVCYSRADLAKFLLDLNTFWNSRR